MPPKRKAAKKSKGQPAVKRPRKQDDPVWLTESEKSPLVYQDLVATYSNPDTYKDWTKEDWEEARECLPPDAPYNEDGYSVPMEYFKYDIDWRRYVREFQEDLGAGRLDPEWQRQAQQAMEERARGDFDQYKDDQFEQFWGQKQKTASHEIAGESAKIKLDEMVKGGVFRKGDVFSFQRVFGKGKDRLMVEKDARIVEIENGRLTLGVPPGQLKYARYLPTPAATPQKPIAAKVQAHDRQATGPQETEFEKDQSERMSEIPLNNGLSKTTQSPVTLPDGHERTERVETDNENEAKDNPQKDSSNDELDQDTATAAETATVLEHSTSTPPAKQSPDKMPEPGEGRPSSDGAAAGSHDHLAGGDRPRSSASPATWDNVREEVKDATPPSDSTVPTTIHESMEGNNSQSDPADKPVEDVILVSFSSLAELERRMVEIDGRVTMQGYRAVNSWKAIRAERDNQDMGSLFDMRERFYVEQSPTIVKEPQRTRNSVREPKGSRKRS